MNRNLPVGYVIGAVEYAGGGEWGMQMYDHIARDTATPQSVPGIMIWGNVNTPPGSISGPPHGAAQLTSFFRHRYHVGLHYRSQYWNINNISSQNPLHPTSPDTLVPRFYFTIFRENNLPLINHWAFEMDGNERLNIEHFPSVTGNFHRLQDGINHTVYVGGYELSARNTWHESRTNVSLGDSVGIGIPSLSREERIIRDIDRYYVRYVELRFTSDGDPDWPLGDTPYRTPDRIRYSPDQDDRVIFSWYVLSEHWHVSSWTRGPNVVTQGYNPAGGSGTLVGNFRVREYTGGDCIEYSTPSPPGIPQCITSATRRN